MIKKEIEKIIKTKNACYYTVHYDFKNLETGKISDYQFFDEKEVKNFLKSIDTVGFHYIIREIMVAHDNSGNLLDEPDLRNWIIEENGVFLKCYCDKNNVLHEIGE